MMTAETGRIISELISASQEARIKPGFFYGHLCGRTRALYRDFLLVCERVDAVLVGSRFDNAQLRATIKCLIRIE